MLFESGEKPGFVSLSYRESLAGKSASSGVVVATGAINRPPVLIMVFVLVRSPVVDAPSLSLALSVAQQALQPNTNGRAVMPGVEQCHCYIGISRLPI
jgi:hypothetical protein